ncbi:MAG: methionyl-tRNA formyltransferase [Saprospiraceae bacterium]
MRIVFMGTPEFAVPALQILLENGYEIPAVVTAPDKPGGRLGMQQSAVKQFALERGLKVLQPEKLKDAAFLESFRALQADLLVVVAFRMLPEVVWSLPPLGAVNLHGSLLPKYRGAAPINWAVIQGEKETGLTTFFLKKQIDTGDILFQESLPIGPDETAGELHDRMMRLGAALILKTVRAIESGTAQAQPQTDALATLAPKIFPEDCQIDFDRPVAQVHNFVRGLSPYPGAWTMLDGKILKILRGRPLETGPTNTPPGQFSSDGKHWLRIRAADGLLEVLELQLEGKRRMPVRDFLNGFKRDWEAEG